MKFEWVHLLLKTVYTGYPIIWPPSLLRPLLQVPISPRHSLLPLSSPYRATEMIISFMFVYKLCNEYAYRADYCLLHLPVIELC